MRFPGYVKMHAHLPLKLCLALRFVAEGSQLLIEPVRNKSHCYIFNETSGISCSDYCDQSHQGKEKREFDPSFHRKSQPFRSGSAAQLDFDEIIQRVSLNVKAC